VSVNVLVRDPPILGPRPLIVNEIVNVDSIHPLRPPRPPREGVGGTMATPQVKMDKPTKQLEGYTFPTQRLRKVLNESNRTPLGM
jgi:hypothetical protein